LRLAVTGAVRVDVLAMRPRHLRGVVAIEDRTNPRPWSHQLFASELDQVSARCFVAVVRRSVVAGFACLMSTGHETHVTNLGVDPDLHRRGIGTRLLLRLVHETIEMGLRDMTLEVRRSNVAAQALYRRFGFVDEGVRPGYYQDGNEDALIMWARGIDDDSARQRRAAVEAALASRP
jgi:ribosomal-protein-alanine N-acetyltransferase